MRRPRGGALWGVPAGLFLLVAALVAAWAVAEVRGASPVRSGSGGGAGPPRAAQTPSRFPAFLEEGTSRSKPRLLTTAASARRAAVLQAVTARRFPRTGAAAVATLRTRTPEGTDAVVLALEEREDEIGLPWVRVRLPVLPHGTTGWVPRQALGAYTLLRTRLVLDTTRLRATLFLRGKAVFRAPIGIGKAKWPTPRGDFFVRNELRGFGDPFYGPIAFGTSARSTVLTDWPKGGFVGIHGTNRPDLIPGRVSHGCVRLRNGDILRLGRLMPIGTPVEIV